MKQLAPLEEAIAKMHKDLPHLPSSITKWLVDNAWWLVVIGVVIGVFAALSILTALTAGSAIVGAFLGASAGGVVFASSLVSLIAAVLTLTIEATAIQPLKAKQKRGWDLVFLAFLVGIVGSVVSAIFGGAYGMVSGIIWTLVWGAVGLYLLFELRVHYVGAKSTSK